MPNRVIRDSILTSRQVGQLDWFQQALLVRLILSCDDYGRYFAAPDIIRNRFFCIYPGGHPGPGDRGDGTAGGVGIIHHLPGGGRTLLCLPPMEQISGLPHPPGNIPGPRPPKLRVRS